MFCFENKFPESLTLFILSLYYPPEPYVRAGHWSLEI